MRGQRGHGEELVLVERILIYWKPSIINLLLKKLEHVVVWRSQVLVCLRNWLLFVKSC